MDILLDSLKQYYITDKNIYQLLEVIESTNKISLRIIDWFVTNYSKKNNIYYTIYRTSDGRRTFEGDIYIYVSQMHDL